MKSLVKHGVRPTTIWYEPAPENPAQLLRVSRMSDVTGAMNKMDLPITEQHLIDWLGTADRPGKVIQAAMPHLTAEQREFLVSGCTPTEWKERVMGEKA